MCRSSFETHQRALVSAEHGVGEGRARAVVTGHETSVETPCAPYYLQRIHAKIHLEVWQSLPVLTLFGRSYIETSVSCFSMREDAEDLSSMITMLFVLAASCLRCS